MSDPGTDAFTTTVVVPLDGSARAEAALPVAAAVVAQTGADLVLVSVADQAEGADRRAYLDAVQQRTGATDAQVVIDADDDVAEAILRVARRAGSPLLCASSHGRTGLANVVIGSTAEALVSAGELPVLLVGPRCRTDRPPTAGLLLVPLDGSRRANRIVPLAIRAAKSFGLEPSLLHVAHPLDVEVAHDPGATLQAAAEAFAQAGVPVAENVLFEHPAAAYISSYALRMDAALIVMSSHLRGGVQRLTHQSVAMATVHRAPCPVLVQNA